MKKGHCNRFTVLSWKLGVVVGVLNKVFDNCGVNIINKNYDQNNI